MEMGNSSAVRVKSVGIISKPAKPELVQILPALYEWFRKHVAGLGFEGEFVVFGFIE